MENKFVMEACNTCGRKGDCSLAIDVRELEENSPLILKNAGCELHTESPIHDCASCTATTCSSHPRHEESECEHDCESCDLKEECKEFNNDIANYILSEILGISRRGNAVIAPSVLTGIMQGVSFAHKRGKPATVAILNTTTAKTLGEDLVEAKVSFEKYVASGLPKILETPFGKLNIEIDDSVSDMSYYLGTTK